jgi:hypothetical protein
LTAKNQALASDEDEMAQEAGLDMRIEKVNSAEASNYQKSEKLDEGSIETQSAIQMYNNEKS